jgi:hypothetical protein
MDERIKAELKGIGLIKVLPKYKTNIKLYTNALNVQPLTK